MIMRVPNKEDSQQKSKVYKIPSYRYITNVEILSLDNDEVEFSCYQLNKQKQEFYHGVRLLKIVRPDNMDKQSWSSIQDTVALLANCGSHTTPITFSKDGWDFGIDYELITSTSHPAYELMKYKTDKLLEFHEFRKQWKNNPKLLHFRKIRDIINDVYVRSWTPLLVGMRCKKPFQ